MINYNGEIISKETKVLSVNNRAYKYGDALFETLKVKGNNLIFAEDHYFRLMASMRMLRMKIPMEFSFSFFKNEILKTLEAVKLVNARVRFSVFRKDGGLYLPTKNVVIYSIEAYNLVDTIKEIYKIDIFKDYHVNSGMLSTLKTTNKLLNVVASIYADENELDSCVLLNEKKQLVEMIHANIFLVKGNQIFTPAIAEGCLKGVVRKNIIAIIRKDAAYEIIETEISPFELQKVDEVFISNSIIGIQPVTNYRKKTYNTVIAKNIAAKLKIEEGKWS